MIVPLQSLMSTISLTQLLSTCMDASHQGCQIIRDFQKKNALKGTLKETNEIKSVVTQADIDAQTAIINGLRNTWGSELCIIGEEDMSVMEVDNGMLLKKDLIKCDNDDEVNIKDITIFVDPLDGTREFVEGRLENVACLIGIAKNNRSIGGVVALPFHEVRIHYSIGELNGIWPKQSHKVSNNVVTIYTGDSNDAILQNATKYALGLTKTKHEIVGGTAAKLVKVASTPNSLAILHFKTELWDTCPLESLLHSQGGKITDLFGGNLAYDPHRKFGNVFGVVASSAGLGALHDELCSGMRRDCRSIHKVFKKWMGGDVVNEAQAVDLARDLDGIPLSTSYIQSLFNNGVLKGYTVPEAHAWRGMMSTGVRLNLLWEENQSNLPKSLFYKRISMAELSHAKNKLSNAPHKLTRDVKSYQVETSFLTSKACQKLLQDTNIHINRVYGSDLRPVHSNKPKELLESKFALILEDFDDEVWCHQWLLDYQGVKASLDALAKLHAYFWNRDELWEELDVWENGGYMSPALQGLDQLKQVKEGWLNRYPTFQERLTDLDDLHSIGEKLERIAFVVGQKAHPFSMGEKIKKEFERYKTIIHGDPKQANIFFKKEDKLQVGLIDFQWCGFGLAGTDIAHHITAAVHASCLSNDGSKENELLDYYYNCLSRYLVEYGAVIDERQVEEIFPRDVLQEHYEVGVLDVCRMVFAYAWRRWKEETEPTAESLNRNAYNKSLPNVLWLIRRCHFLLEKYRDIE